MLFKQVTLLLLFVLSCGSNPQKKLAQEKQTPSIETLNCPNTGTCNAEIIEQKIPELAYDQYNNSYLNYVDHKNSFIKFEYIKHQDPQIMDGGYREELIIAYSDDLLYDGNVLELKNYEVIYGRFCFCRGQSGYYIINDGQLKIKKEKEGVFILDLQFSIDEVPQELKLIRFKLSH